MKTENENASQPFFPKPIGTEHLKRAQECDRSNINSIAVAASDDDVINFLLEEAHKRLDYHRPSADQLPRYAALRDAAKNFATVIIRNCPPETLQKALDQNELTLMMANKSIALEPK